MRSDKDEVGRSVLYDSFGHHDQSRSVDDWIGSFDHMRAACPIGRSTLYGGFWIVTGHAEARDILTRPELFSSSSVMIPPHGQCTPMVPLEIDPPKHSQYRKLLNEAFAPTLALDRHRQPIRDTVNRMIDRAVEQGEFDACETFAEQLPCVLATTVLGLPADNAGILRRWIHMIIHESAIRPEAATEAAIEHHEYFSAEFARRRGARTTDTDVLSILLNTEVNGARLSEEELLGFCLLLLLASIDTTQKTIGSIFYQLASAPDIRDQLARNPSDIPRAVEEFLRMWAPVQTSRIAVGAAEVAGHRLLPGDPVLISLLAANRDPREFASPHDFRPNRSPNRHLAFGTGIHRCPGSHIARLELRILLEELMLRIPDFELRDHSAVVWTPGQAQGMTRVPIRILPSEYFSARSVG